MNSVILDTSAVLAYLFEEPGAEAVAAVLEIGAGVMSSVNYAELVSKLVDQGIPSTTLREICANLELTLVDYDEAQAFLTGELRQVGKSLGLSLGDRACLALGMQRQLPILTADRVWLNLVLPVEVRLIRGDGNDTP